MATPSDTMASLYQKSNSKFWWIKFRDPKTGKIRGQSTGLKIGTGADTRNANELVARYSLEERQARKSSPSERWESWVTEFLNVRYRNSPVTLDRILTAWRTLRMFLEAEQIEIPRQLTRDHCFSYMAWRAKPNTAKGKYRACHNTALLELKFLRVIMREAVLRKYAISNPCSELEIRREAGKVKPELTPDITLRIRAAIQKQPEPLRSVLHHSFEISYYHAVRLAATYLNPMEDVWQEKGEWCIRFTQKGDRTSTKVLHPQLIPMFEALRAAGKTETFPKPPRREYLSTIWFRFLRNSGIKQALPGVSFHSTRVTVATNLARAGVDQRLAMEYVDHASTTVHRSYVRLRPQDFSKPCHDAIK